MGNFFAPIGPPPPPDLPKEEKLCTIFTVFLPQVAPEQAWNLATTLSYLSQKAGLSSDAWREGAKFETFQAEVFHE